MASKVDQNYGLLFSDNSGIAVKVCLSDFLINCHSTALLKYFGIVHLFVICMIMVSVIVLLKEDLVEVSMPYT